MSIRLVAAAARRAFGACAVLLGGLALASGCAKKSGETSAPRSASSPVIDGGRARSQAFIVAGNDAYKAGDYELALKRYASAAVADPRDPAAYFGMGMTFSRLRREDEARAAYARAQQLAREEAGAPASP